MRLRLTDGTREVLLDTTDTTPLADAETTALHLWHATAAPEQPAAEERTPIGFTGADLDRVALDSSHERADPEPYDDQDDDEQQAQHERRVRP